MTIPPNIQELFDRCANDFRPKSIDDFVGSTANEKGCGARAMAVQMSKIVQMAKVAGNKPIKVLLNGAPGVGKTNLCLYLQHLLGCDKWSVTAKNGTQIKMETLDEIERALHYRSLFGEYRVIRVDEADAVPATAQTRFLSLLDDLPPGVCVLATSNCRVKEFEARFQTRFQVFEVQPPWPQEIATLLERYIDPENAGQIAEFACGNVRSALLDAQGLVQQTMFAAAA